MYDLRYMGDEVLREKCQPIEKFTSEIEDITQNLKRLMLEFNGVGLAAPQVGIPLRIFVVGISDKYDEKNNPLLMEPKVYINPKILRHSEEKIVMPEGCLSIPGLTEDIERSSIIDIEAFDESGNKFVEKNIEGWKARCILHENDHLDGILFIDYLSSELKEKHKENFKAVQNLYLQSQMKQTNSVQDFFKT